MSINYKPNVCNLSNISLTSGQLDLLGRGLGFSVSPSGVTNFRSTQTRTNSCADFVYENIFTDVTTMVLLPTALSEPPLPKIQKHTSKNWILENGRNIFLDSYINVLKEEIGKTDNTKVFSNISNQEIKALSELKALAGRDIVILPVDKGGGTCVVSIQRRLR